MTDVERVLADYVAEQRAGGEADPRDYLARVAPERQPELAALIDAYLTRVPRAPFDQVAFRGSGAERTVDELERALGGQSGLWPALLPRLRARAGVKRSELVGRLAAALGADEETSKVASYYHQMEQGILPAQGVSDRVLDALGQIVGEPARALREAGRSLGPPRADAPPPSSAFARRASGEADASRAPERPPAPGTQEWDRVDEMFLGG